MAPCRKRSPAKGVWQKSDEKSDRSIRKRFRFFFFRLGRGKGESEAPGGEGDRFSIENPRREGSLGREGPRCREGVCSELGDFGGGGGLNIFWGGRNVHQAEASEKRCRKVTERVPKPKKK